jgi:hypothetical protein
LCSYGSANLDHLLGSDRKIANSPIRMNLGMVKAGENFESFCATGSLVEPSEARGLDAHQYVFGDRQVGAQRELLVYQRYAVATGLER